MVGSPGGGRQHPDADAALDGVAEVVDRFGLRNDVGVLDLYLLAGHADGGVAAESSRPGVAHLVQRGFAGFPGTGCIQQHPHLEAGGIRKGAWQKRSIIGGLCLAGKVVHANGIRFSASGARLSYQSTPNKINWCFRRFAREAVNSPRCLIGPTATMLAVGARSGSSHTDSLESAGTGSNYWRCERLR